MYELRITTHVYLYICMHLYIWSSFSWVCKRSYTRLNTHLRAYAHMHIVRTHKHLVCTSQKHAHPHTCMYCTYTRVHVPVTHTIIYFRMNTQCIQVNHNSSYIPLQYEYIRHTYNHIFQNEHAIYSRKSPRLTYIFTVWIQTCRLFAWWCSYEIHTYTNTYILIHYSACRRTAPMNEGFFLFTLAMHEHIRYKYILNKALRPLRTRLRALAICICKVQIHIV